MNTISRSNTFMEVTQNIKILIVDDDPISSSILAGLVKRLGYEVVLADNGTDAWAILLNDNKICIAFIDWVMPGLDGPTLCTYIKEKITDRYIYSIVVTSRTEKADLVQCMEAGADEFFSKPVHEGELISRLHAGQRMLACEQHLRSEMCRADELLKNILPSPIAARLKAGETYIADVFADASIMFIDIVGFTDWCLETEATAMVAQLNSLFALFDSEIEKFGLEKIKSVGDAYLIAGGVPFSLPDHATAMVELSLSIQEKVAELNRTRDKPWRIRTGIASGAVIAGVIGYNRFIYDVWGDTVNNASRLESVAGADEIFLSETTQALLTDEFECVPLGEMILKGMGAQKVWRLVGKQLPQEELAAIGAGARCLERSVLTDR